VRFRVNPGSGKVSLLEEFVQEIVDRTKSQSEALRREPRSLFPLTRAAACMTAVLSSPLDFFGDGPRMPMLVISPFSTGGTRRAFLQRSSVGLEVHRTELASRQDFE